MSPTIVIVGGGIAGMSAAYTLQQESDSRVVLIEPDHLGGKILTSHFGDFLIEHGPDAIFTAKPAAMELIEELGLGDLVIEPLQSEFSILSKGKLHSVPRPLVSLMSVGSTALEKVGFLSSSAKRRVLQESSVPKGVGNDESVASFFRRRFGRKFSMSLAEPMLAGIHAGDPEKLSMAALYPAYLGFEQRNGSLTTQTSAPPTGKYSGKKPGFVTLRNGLEELPQKLLKSLKNVEVRLGERVRTMDIRDRQVHVQTAKGECVADQVILAIPAFAAAEILAEAAPRASELLSRIRYASTAVASLGYARSVFSHELLGNGFLVPTDEPCAITGCTWSSNKWRGRAPDDQILIRAFMGRDGGLDVMSESEESLMTLAESALAAILGPKEPPVLRKVHRWPNAMPQYEIGHLELMNQVESELGALPVRLAGSGYRGSGIPDCIRQGREAARSLIKEKVSI